MLELRAASGGEDARLFCAELEAMYRAFCRRRGLSCELVDERREGRSLRRAALLIEGPGAS